MKAQAGFALLLAGCALLSVSAQSVADFASKEKRLEMAETGGELWKQYVGRDKSQPFTMSITSARSQKTLAGFGDLVCAGWKKEIGDRIPKASDKVLAGTLPLDIDAGVGGLQSYFREGDEFDNVPALMAAFRFLVDVCDERTTGELKTVEGFSGKNTDIMALGAKKIEEYDPCPNYTSGCAECTGDASCVWCDGDTPDTRYCAKGNLFGPAASSAKLTLSSFPVSHSAEDKKRDSCKAHFKFAFCQEPCSNASSCGDCISKPMCVWCPQPTDGFNTTAQAAAATEGKAWGGICAEGNREGFNGDFKCDAPDGVVALHSRTGNDKCPLIKNPPPAIDGGWGDWTEFAPCIKHPVTGVCSKKRTRACDTPKQFGAGLRCAGPPKESKVCSAAECDLPVSAVLTKNAGVKMSTVEQKISFAKKGVVNATKFLNVSTDALRAESAKELPNLAALKKLSAEAQDARFDLDDKKFEVLKLEGDLLAARYERLISSSMDNCHKQMPVKNVAPQSAVTATNCIRPTNCGKQLIDGKKDFNGLDWHTKKDQRTGASATFDLGTEHAYTISVINVFNQNAGNGWDVKYVSIQHSNTNVTWQNVTMAMLPDSKGATPNPSKAITFPETKARFWRLVLEGFHASTHGAYAGLMEVQLMAKTICDGPPEAR